jgi:xylulokinase
LGGQYLVGIDVGTLGSKGVVVDIDGNVLAEEFREHGVIHPRPGWAEHDPEEHWWKDFVLISRAIIEKSGIAPGEIAAVGTSSLIPDMTPLDEKGRPIRNSIIYSDNRAVEEISYVNKVFSTMLTSEEITPKILWMKKHEPQNYEKTRMVVNAVSYLVWKLTGKFTVGYGLAYGYGGVFDPVKREWSEEACEKLDLSVEIFPPVFSPADVAGGVTAEAAEETGLSEGTPVIVGTADSAMSSLGAGMVEEGESKIYYGTAGLFHVLEQDLEERLTGVWGFEPSKYGRSYMLTSGEALKWFRDSLGFQEVEAEKHLGLSAYRQLDEKAAKIPPGSDGVVVLPYFMGQRSPEFNPFARAVIFGLSISHTRIHIYRALLEAFGYGVYHGMLTGREKPKRIIATGGGARSPLWRQIVSDIINLPQEYIAKASAPLGDAYFAGYGIGIFKDFKTIRDRWVEVTAVTEPRADVHEKYLKLFEVYKGLHVLKDQFTVLEEFLD